MEKIIFGIVFLHIIAGFGWVVYKLQFRKKNSNKESNDNSNSDNINNSPDDN
jgi:hypothetical protein